MSESTDIKNIAIVIDEESKSDPNINIKDKVNVKFIYYIMNLGT